MAEVPSAACLVAVDVSARGDCRHHMLPVCGALCLGAPGVRVAQCAGTRGLIFRGGGLPLAPACYRGPVR